MKEMKIKKFFDLRSFPIFIYTTKKKKKKLIFHLSMDLNVANLLFLYELMNPFEC